MKQNDAYTLGFIARMNGQKRNALADEKLTSELPTDFLSKTPLIISWIDGYDACTLEYTRVLTKRQKL